MFFTKNHSSEFYKNWYLAIISAITKDGKRSYGPEEVKQLLIPRLDKIELYLQPGLIKEWHLSDKREKQKLIEQIKEELLNPDLL
jgi:hypothetical protein